MVTQRGDGGSVFVTWREAPLDTANVEAPAEMFESQRNDVSGKTAAMLVLANDDGSCEWSKVGEADRPVRVQRGVATAPWWLEREPAGRPVRNPPVPWPTQARPHGAEGGPAIVS